MPNPNVGRSQETLTYYDDTFTTIKKLEIMWHNKDPVWQEMHTTAYFEFLVLI